MHGVRISGHLLATSNWHVTDGTDDNVTRVMKTGIVSGVDTDDGQAPDAPPRLSQVPVVPANSIRGRLRRHALSLLTESLAKRGQWITKEAYQMLSNGGMIGGRDAGPLTVGELVRARRNVFVGLWGGGPRLIPSTVVTNDIVPVCAETVASGRVPRALVGFAPVTMRGGSASPHTELARGWELIKVRMFKRNDDMMQANQDAVARLSVLGEDAAAQIAAYQAEQLTARDERRLAKESAAGKDVRTLSDEEKDQLKKKDLTNFLQMEVVIPGTVWPLEVTASRWATDAQIGLLCRGMELFVNEQNLGGMKRWGFGSYRARLSIEAHGEVIGQIAWDEAVRAHRLRLDNDRFDVALQEELSAVTGAEVNMFASATKKAAKDDGEAPERNEASKPTAGRRSRKAPEAVAAE